MSLQLTARAIASPLAPKLARSDMAGADAAESVRQPDSGPHADSPPDSAEPLCRSAKSAYEYVRDELGGGRCDFSAFESWRDGVCIKNADGVVVFSNPAHSRVFVRGGSPIGRTAQSYLDPAMAQRCEAVDALLMGGVPYVQLEHSGHGPDGSSYRVQAHKRSLQELNHPGFATLTVLRLLERSESPNASMQLSLTSAAERFRNLSERDQEICRLTALGVSSRELGDRLGMTTRGIELRKQKAFAKLGVAKAVDLARMLVRLQDRGFLDLGL